MTCGRTTRRSRGSRRINIRTRCTSAVSTDFRFDVTPHATRRISCRAVASPTVTAPQHRQANPTRRVSRNSTQASARCSRPGDARRRLRPVGDNPARGGSRVCKRPGGGQSPTQPPPRGGGSKSPQVLVCSSRSAARWRGASARDRHKGCPVAAGALGRLLSLTVVRPGTVEGARRRLFGQIVHGAVAALGTLVDRLGAPLVDLTNTPRGGTFLVRCGLAPRQGEAERLCIPAGGGLRA